MANKKGAGRKAAPANETTHDKLVRLSAQRVTKAVKAIKVCGNLSAYAPTAQESAKILNALAASYEAAKARLTAPAGVKQAEAGFTL